MNTKAIVFSSIIASVFFLSGCAGPKITGSSMSSDLASKNYEILLIDDTATRESFSESMESWFKDNNKNYSVKPEHSKHDPEKISVEFVGYWGWDLSPYMKKAEIEAFYDGQRVSRVNFKAPDSLNPKKWGDPEYRIGLMLDVLFGEKTATEATKDL